MGKYTILTIILLLSIIVIIPRATTQDTTAEVSSVTIKRTASTDTVCASGRCTLRLYSGNVNMLDENGAYKPFTDVVNLSFKNNVFNISWYEGYIIIEPFVVYNGVERKFSDIKLAFPDINMKDYIAKSAGSYKYAINYSGVSSSLLLNVNNLGFKLKEAKGIKWDEIVKSNGEIIIKDKIRLNFQDLVDSGFTLNLVNKSYLLIGNIQESNGVVYLDPTISLTINNVRVEDTYVVKVSPDTNFGNTGSIEAGVYRNISIKFGMAPIPQNAELSSVYLSLLWDFDPPHSSGNVSVWELNNQTWIETQPTWNAPVKTVGNMINYTALISKTFKYVTWNVTKWVKSEYNNDKGNVSFYLIADHTNITSGNISFRPSEDAFAGYPPALNVSYSLIIDYARFYRNFTNTTTPRTNENIRFNINWTSNGSLSNSYFETNISGSTVNHTIFNSASSNTSVKINLTNTTPNNLIGRFYWKSYANSSSGNWNQTNRMFLTVTETEPPRFYRNFTNTTTPRTNENIRFNINLTDNIRLSNAYFEINITGSTKNFTIFHSASNTSVRINLTNTTPNNLIGRFFWKYYFNDSNNNWNRTNRMFLTVSDTSFPYFTNITNNNRAKYHNNDTTPEHGQVINLSIVINDNVDISHYRFATNNTGIWANRSWVTVSGSQTTATNWTRLTANSTHLDNYGWRFYANDSSGNINSSRINWFNNTDIIRPKVKVHSISTGSVTPSSDISINDTIKLNFCWYNISEQITPRTCQGTCPTYFTCGTEPTISGGLSDGGSYIIRFSANDTSGNRNETNKGSGPNTFNWTISISGGGGGGGGGGGAISPETLLALGFECKADDECASGKCDLKGQEKGICTTEFCGNNFCDKDRGENPTSCFVDCNPIQQGIQNLGGIAAASIFVSIILISFLLINPRRKKKKKIEKK